MKFTTVKFFFCLFIITTLLFTGFRPVTVNAAPSIAVHAQEFTTGVYVSDLLPAGDSKGHTLTLTLNDDSSATLATDAMDGKDPIVEVGEWHQSKKGNIVLDLSGTQDKKYNKPVELVFKSDGDQLITVGYDKKLYGKDGFTLTLSDAASDAASLDAGQAVTNTAEVATSNPVTETTPITASQALTSPATVDKSNEMTATVEVNKSSEMTATAEVGKSSDMTATNEVDQSDEITDTALTFVSDILPSADTDGIQIRLELAQDQSATMITDYMDGKDPLIEIGTWAPNAKNKNQLDLTLTGTDTETYDKPIAIVFDVDPTTQALTTAEYDTELFGEDGFSLALDDSKDTDSEDIDTEGTDTEGTDTQDSIAGVYNSDVLPAADSPGLVITLDLMENGNVEMVSNYLNGKLPIVEMGSWTDNGNETIAVVLTSTLDAGKDDGTLIAYDKPSEMTFDVYLDALYSDNLYLDKLSREDLSDSSSDSTDNSASDSALSDDAVTSMIYTSGKLSSAPTPDMQVTLELIDDGTLVMTTDYGDGSDPLVEIGDWEEDQKDGSLQVTVTGTEDEEYEEPIELVFEENNSTLVATEYDEEIFGKNGVELALEEK